KHGLQNPVRGRSRRVRVEAVANGNCERRMQLGSVKKRRYRFYLRFLEPVKVETTILVDLELLAELLKVLCPLTLKCQNKECDNTMEELHRFRVVAWWASGRTGIAKSSSAPNAIHFTSPPAFGGLEGRWTPEDLLLCALASCYTTTFQTLAEYSKFEYTDLQVEADGVISKGATGYSFGEVSIHANLTISQEEERAQAIKL